MMNTLRSICNASHEIESWAGISKKIIKNKADFQKEKSRTKLFEF